MIGSDLSLMWVRLFCYWHNSSFFVCNQIIVHAVLSYAFIFCRLMPCCPCQLLPLCFTFNVLYCWLNRASWVLHYTYDVHYPTLISIASRPLCSHGFVNMISTWSTQTHIGTCRCFHCHLFWLTCGVLSLITSIRLVILTFKNSWQEHNWSSSYS